MSAPDPLSVRCPYCRRPAGQACVARRHFRPPFPAARAHLPRKRLALAVAAHADPVLDEHFRRIGPCGVCAVPGLDQRHRVVDAVAGLLAAGEIREQVSAELDVTMESIDAVETWMTRWPGAWQ